jgi:peptidoglycan hydrolase-like protein with peptidoglycan-binding domain
VKRNSRGDVVRDVQERLAELGYKNSAGTKPLVVDGRFGPVTEQRVKDFQRDHKCPPVDGIVGPKTWAALFG